VQLVGWKTSDSCDTDLVLGAREYGIWSRDVRDGQLIHHSDPPNQPATVHNGRTPHGAAAAAPRSGS
jgi:hypothetical protein